MKTFPEFLAYAVFAAVVGLLSVWPPYELLGQQRAIISLVFSHAGARLGECRSLTQEELNELPPNMRKPGECPRERHPVRVELRTGDRVLYKRTLQPSGIWADGKATVYQRIEVAAGSHDLHVGMNDTGGKNGFDFELSSSFGITPGSNVVVRFDERTQQFSIQ